MSLVRLHIKEISYSQSQRGAYVLIFKETTENKTLPIVIGAFEAQAIVLALEKELKSPRPLTHDLFKTFTDKFHIEIKQVIIYKLTDGIFYSNLICEQDGVEQHIDARTSDAVALAIRSNAPIFIYKEILDEAGVHLTTIENEQEDNSDYEEEDDSNFSLEDLEDFLNVDEESAPSITEYSLEELQEKLNKAIEQEDYEAAAQIRDAIDQKNK